MFVLTIDGGFGGGVREFLAERAFGFIGSPRDAPEYQARASVVNSHFTQRQ
jgi:hypothetical protein